MSDLIDQLREAEDPFTCPHGRPIIINFSKYELEKLFKRVMQRGMNQVNNNILPAIRNIKDLEKLIKTDYKMCVLLDMHIGHIKVLWNC